MLSEAGSYGGAPAACRSSPSVHSTVITASRAESPIAARGAGTSSVRRNTGTATECTALGAGRPCSRRSWKRLLIKTEYGTRPALGNTEPGHVL